MNTSACIPERKSFKKFVKKKKMTQTSLEHVSNSSSVLCNTNVFCFQELTWNWLMTKKTPTTPRWRPISVSLHRLCSEMVLFHGQDIYMQY